MILITGAAGKTGQAIIKTLTAKNQPVRAWVHREAYAQKMREIGSAEVVIGDFHSPMVLKTAFTKVKAVYHICPNVNPDELSISRAVLNAAKAAAVEHFVYHSVLHPQIEVMPHHWQKLRVEEAIFESGIPFTIVQPAAYMQNILAHQHRIISHGVLPIPYQPQTRISMVDLVDVAEVAAAILTESGHENAIYELCGSKPLSQSEVVEIIGKTLKRAIRTQQISLAEWKTSAEMRGMDAYQVETLLKMFRYYDQYGFVGNSQVLESLLGRSATRFKDFVKRTMRSK